MEPRDEVMTLEKRHVAQSPTRERVVVGFPRLPAIRLALLGSMLGDPLPADRAQVLVLAAAFTTDPGPQAYPDREN